MKTRNPLLIRIAPLVALLLAGCSEPPQPVEMPKPAPAATQPPGHPTLPVTEAAMSGEAARASGTILFEGAQFDDPKGSLFVSVRMKGQRAPWLSRKYPLEGVEFAKNEAGVKSMPFEVRADDPTPMVGTFNSNTVWITAPPGMELELYACYKPDGDAGSKTLADATAVFESGKTDYALKLTLP